MFDVVDKRDDVLDAADNNKDNDANKKSINDEKNTFNAVENDRDDSDTNKMMPLDGFGFFLTLRP